MEHPVAVTGFALACATGPDVDAFRSHLRDGASTVRPIAPGRMISAPDGRATPVAASIVDGSPPEAVAEDLGYLLRAASRQAGSALDGLPPVPPDRLGVVLATTVGAFFASLAYRRSVLAGHPEPGALSGPVTPAMLAGAVADELGAEGPAFAVLTACAAGTDALGQGSRLVAQGVCDRVVVVGADLFSPLSVAGFGALQALSRSGQARPYDVDRDGLTLGDGVAAVVVEDGGGRAEPLAHVLGYASGNEARHPTAPDPDGSTLLAVMRRAYPRDVPLADLGYVNGHGTGTRANDEAELTAFGAFLAAERPHPVPVSSTKHLTGHTLGAAGVVEAIACLLALREGLVPGNHRTTTPLPTSPALRLPAESEEAAVRVAMSVNLAFSGNVSALVLGAP